MNASKHPLIVTLLLSLYWALIFYIALFFPYEFSRALFSEEGVFELFSPYLWWMLAVFCLFGRMSLPTRLLSAFAAVLLGCREMDLHKSLSGMSFLKTHFYRDDAIPLHHKIIGIVLILLLTVLFACLIKKFITACRCAGALRQASGGYILLSGGLLVCSKILDNLNSQLIKLFDIHLSRHINILTQSFEESSEMLVPVLLCMAIVFYPGDVREI